MTRLGAASVEHPGRSVIKPDAGGIEMWRLRAQLWRNRPDQAAVSATVSRTSAVASVALAEAIVLARFSSPTNGEVIQANQSRENPGRFIFPNI